ncbi:MAG TPA: adenylate kinase [Ktedonobacterales bacterium]
MNIIMIGAQGSGKGTQAEALERELGLKPCASGDLLREQIAAGTELGKQAQPYLERGDLVPDELVIGMIMAFMRESQAQPNFRGLTLDGFPRTIPQAEKLDAHLAAAGQRIDRVISLEVPRGLLLERLSGRWICRAHGHVYNTATHPPKVAGVCDLDGSELYQRSDDTPEKIARRLDIFFTETVKLLEYYQQQGKLTRIDGARPIDEVTREMLAALRG